MKGDAFERRELSSPLDTCSLDFYSEFIQLIRGPLKLLARTLHTAHSRWYNTWPHPRKLDVTALGWEQNFKVGEELSAQNFVIIGAQLAFVISKSIGQ